MVLLGGTIAAAPMGGSQCLDPDAAAGALPPMFRSYGKARTNSSVTFVSQASLDAGLAAGSASPRR